MPAAFKPNDFIHKFLFGFFLEYYSPINGAKRHEFPMIGNSFGPGTSEYGRTCGCFVDSLSLAISVDDCVTSFGNMLMADENVVRLTSELAAIRVPIMILILLCFLTNQLKLNAIIFHFCFVL